MKNKSVFDVKVNTVYLDTTIDVSPDTTLVSAMSESEYNVRFILQCDSVHIGHIVFKNKSPDSLASTYFEAGFISEKDCSVSALPAACAVFPAYPNPTSGYIVIPLALPNPDHVRIRILNSRGAMVANLFDGNLTRGYQQVAWNTQGVEHGIYKCYIEVGDFNCQGDIQVK